VLSLTQLRAQHDFRDAVDQAVALAAVCPAAFTKLLACPNTRKIKTAGSKPELGGFLGRLSARGDKS